MLIDPRTKSVILNAADPLAIRASIPFSRLLTHADYNVAVKHTPVTTRKLRELGYDAPSPINVTYNWPGKYSPFDHQRVMAEFLTMHKRAFNLSEMGCVSSDTEYLAPDGWRRIDTYTGGLVAQYHPESGQAEFVEPLDYVKKPCTKMVHIKTKYGVDQVISWEHRVLLHSHHKPEKYEVVQAHELYDRHEQWLTSSKVRRTRDQISWGQSTIPTTFSVAGGAGVPLSDAELRLQVAVIADGHFGRATDWCTIRLKKDRKKVRLRVLLAEAGVDYRETEARAAPGFTVFRFIAPRRVKEFDTQFWQATAQQLELIIDEVPHWDGSIRAKSFSFSTYARASADFVQYAAAATGHTARMFDRVRERCGEVETEYVVYVRASGKHLCLQSRASDGTRREVMTPVPSPDGYKYCFMVPSTFLVLRHNGCVFCTGNTGKSASTLWAADWLMSEGLIKKAVVVAPLSTLERVWRNDIFDVLMHRTAITVHGPKEKRLEALDADVDFYIVNHDGLAIEDVNKKIRSNPDINLVVLDEASMFRNARTQKYKMLMKLLRPDMRLWALTGTPTPNSPTDAWALARIVSPERVTRFFGAFQRMTMTQVSQFKWVPRHDAYGIAYDAMQPAVRFKKSECLDLPPVTTQDHEADLTVEQHKAVERMRKEMVAEAKDHEVTAANAADKINKLRQIMCGAIKDPDSGNYLAFDHKPRFRTMLEAIEQASAKVLVIVPFKGIIYELEKELKKHHSVAVVNGDVSPKARDKIILDFKSSDDPHVLLCHPKVMAHGLNLTEADTLIFYAPIYSNDEFQQVTERFNRTGQTRKMTIVRIGAHPLEWKIYGMVDKKKLTQDNILALYKAVTG